MGHFIEGLDRQQAMLLPEHPEDYVDERSPVRTIDALPTCWISRSLASTRSPLPLVGPVIIRG
jgi:hypothetical protein